MNEGERFFNLSDLIGEEASKGLISGTYDFTEFRKKLIQHPFRKAVTSEFEKSLSLLYAPSLAEGNVCFATNNEELRDEFKVAFTAVDVAGYVTAFFKGQKSGSFGIPIPYPGSAEDFWQMVKKSHPPQTQ